MSPDKIAYRAENELKRWTNMGLRPDWNQEAMAVKRKSMGVVSVSRMTTFGCISSNFFDCDNVKKIIWDAYGRCGLMAAKLEHLREGLTATSGTGMGQCEICILVFGRIQKLKSLIQVVGNFRRDFF